MTTAKNLTPTLNLKGLGRLAISLIVSLLPVANAQHCEETLKFKPTKDQGGVEIPEAQFLGPDLDVKEVFVSYFVMSKCCEREHVFRTRSLSHLLSMNPLSFPR